MNIVISYIKKHKKIFIIIGVILIVIIIGLLFCCFNDNKGGKDSAIDRDSATYQGKKIYVDDEGNTIIEESNNSKTIETVKIDSKYIVASEDIKSKYSISDIKITKKAATSYIKGKIKNNGSKYKEVYVNVKFYENDKIVGSGSVLVKDLKKKKTKDFEIKMVGDFTNYEYKAEVEYVA